MHQILQLNCVHIVFFIWLSTKLHKINNEHIRVTRYILKYQKPTDDILAVFYLDY